ncbi:MAG TPA: phosphate ABC transporter permease PstA [Thermoplasmata archaeon]|nr:phosphate ABC transporter permease PstA [Thermoplasmata archaeon]
MRFDRDTRRRWKNWSMVGVSLLCVAAALVPLGSILFEVIVRGAGAITPSFLTATQPSCVPYGTITCPPAGVGNALEGTVILLALSSAIAIPVGVLTGVYLSEFGRGRFGTAVRFFADVMTGLPSIVMGVFVFSLFELALPQFVYSTIAGALALSLIMMPFVAIAAMEALVLVPASVREAGLALGIPRFRVSLRVVASAARDGILTGILLALGRIGGETAPLILTSFGNPGYFQGLGSPVQTLTLNVYTLSSYPYPTWITMAWGSALVLVLLMLGLSIVARWLLRPRFRERRIGA